MPYLYSKTDPFFSSFVAVSHVRGDERDNGYK